jgi:hypothetical protein
MSKFHHIVARGSTWLDFRGWRWGLALRFPFSGSFLGRLSGLGLTWIALSAIAPAVVQAEVLRVAIPIVRENDETYQNLLTRAENIARAATQRGFDRSILTTSVIVTVLGQNNGAVVPILQLQVNRPNWQAFPDPQRWAKYYTNANLLLGIEDTPSPTPTIMTPDPANEPAEALDEFPELAPDNPTLPGLPAPFPSFPAQPPLLPPLPPLP